MLTQTGRQKSILEPTAMRRLNFRLPDFTRLNWANEKAKAYWDPKLQSLQLLQASLEVQSVVHGMRRCAMRPISIEIIEQEKIKAAKIGLTLVEVYRFKTNNAYSSEVVLSSDPPNMAMCAFGNIHDTSMVVKLHQDRAARGLGELLGYPECCTDFFEETWEQHRFIDTIWPMSLRTPDAQALDDTHIELSADKHCNLLLKSIGVRPVFHLPCSFNCAGTHETAVKIAELACKLGHSELIQNLYAILDWPIRWTTLHGISEIETPVCRISSKSDSTAVTYTVDKINSENPVFGAAVGTRFPFLLRRPQSTSRPVQHMSKTKEDLQANVDRQDRLSLESLDLEEAYYKSNGFLTRYFMQRAFEPIVDMVLEFDPKSVLYWGCRNAALLRDIQVKKPAMLLRGVDPDREKIEYARKLITIPAGEFHVGQLDDINVLRKISPSEVTLLMIGRLLEIERKAAMALLREMFSRSRVVVTYAHQDWLAGRNLEEIADLLHLQCQTPWTYGGVVSRILLRDQA